MIYFPEFTSNQIAEKNYLFTILEVSREEILKVLIQEAHKKRSIYEEPDINEFVEITDELKKERGCTHTEK